MLSRIFRNVPLFVGAWLIVVVGFYLKDHVDWRNFPPCIPIIEQIERAREALKVADDAATGQAIAFDQAYRSLQQAAERAAAPYRAELASLEGIWARYQDALARRDAARRFATRARYRANHAWNQLSWIDRNVPPLRGAEYIAWLPLEAAAVTAERMAAAADVILAGIPVPDPTTKQKIDAASAQIAAIERARDLRIEQARQLVFAAFEARDAAAATLDELEQRDGAMLARWHRTLKPYYGWALFWATMAVLSPFLWRVLLYVGARPLSRHWPAVVLRPPAEHSARSRALAERSSVGVDVRVGPGDELRVRTPYLRGVGLSARKSTALFLTERRRLSSYASGLTMLTRVVAANEEPTVVSVSAGHVPGRELLVLDVPSGAGLVLRPSALIGVVQPRNTKLTIRSHWRVFSLHAWCTWQLRFLEFVGPCRPIVAGARGVRAQSVDAADPRMVDSAAVLGFSSGLGFKVTPTATREAYLLGHEPLFADLFLPGDGIYVTEEHPTGSDGRREAARLKILLDAVRAPLGI